MMPELDSRHNPATPVEPVPRTRLFQAPTWEWSQRGEIGWWARPEWREALVGPDGLRLAQWRAEGGVSTVKAGPHRVVYRAEVPGRGAVYIKHYLVPNFRSILRQWFRRGKGRNEAKRAVRLAAVGVPTITPVALGEQRKRNFLFENYLVTPEIPDTIPLDQFVEDRLPSYPEPARGRLRRRMAEALGVLTARLHEGGILHTDFHPGNLLVRVDDAGQVHLAMIDLDALRFRPRLDPREALANLALLNHYFWIRSGRADRRRFLRAYLGARHSDLGDAKDFARQVEAATRGWAERLWRRWGKRCLGTNKYFVAYRTRGVWAVGHRDLDSSDVRALMSDPDAPFARPGATILKNSRTTTVAEISLTVRGKPARVIYKRFNRKKWLDPLLTLFRPSRAWRAWRNGQHLASRGLPTPQNLAVLGRTSDGGREVLPRLLPRETYLATIKAEPSITLGEYARSVLPSLSPAARRERIERLIPALARLLRTLHERSLSHRDLKADNILIEGDPDAIEPTLSLIDLVGVALDHPISDHHRIQNLARIQLSLAHAAGRTRTDSLRFLRVYRAGRGLDRTGWKELWRRIDLACDRKVALNRRNGRKLT